jgi:predicted RNA binding protein YcfA (HicA-like mRNA interferase family)
MTSSEKRFKKFLHSPQSLKYGEIENLLVQSGFEMIKAKGSHNKFKHPLLKYDLIIPVHNNDCKSYYKNYAAKILKTLHNAEQ